MAHHAGGRVVGEHAGDAGGGFVGAVAHNHHARVLREAHAHAAAVVQRYPSGAAGGVQQGIEQRPVGNGVRAVLHRFGFAVGAGHRAGIQVIAANHNRGGYFAGTHHFVKRQTELGAQTQAHPADARGQTLEADAFARHVEPAVQGGIVGNQFFHFGIGFVDVFGVARQSHPAERADAAAEQRADVGGHEAGEIESVGHAFFFRHLADVVAVIEGGHAHFLEIEHGLHVYGHRFFGGFHRAFGVGFGGGAVLFPRHVLRQVAVERVVCAGLVGHHIGAHAAAHQFGQHVGSVGAQADGNGAAFGGVFVDARQCVVQIAGLFVQIAGAQAEVDAGLLAFDVQRAGAGQRCGQRLRAAHAAQTGGEDPFAA